jgi:site-specific DNA-methyltransferase (adenine-specific)
MRRRCVAALAVGNFKAAENSFEVEEYATSGGINRKLRGSNVYRILEGDVTEQLKTLADASVDSIVTDPPYGLEFMGKDWDAPWKTDHRQGFDGTMQTPDSPYGRSKVRNGNGASYGADARVMQALQDWYFSWAVEALRVLKPGGYLLAFGGSRTYHRLACAVEDAGFEIRDQIMWIYGSGFPKSLDVSKAIDKAAGEEREVTGTKFGLPGYRLGETGGNEIYGRGLANGSASCKVTAPATDAAKQWAGWGTSLKPSHEPIVVARKPLIGTVAANVLQYGTGAMNIDACRVGFLSGEREGMYRPMTKNNSIGWKNKSECMGYNTPDGLPPALGRWPANVIYDGSDEVLAAFPQTSSGDFSGHRNQPKTDGIYGKFESYEEKAHVGDAGSAARFFKSVEPDTREGEPSANRTYEQSGSTNFAMKPGARRLDQGSAARFFYCAKASREERNRGLWGAEEKIVDDGRKVPIDNPYLRGKTMRSNTHPTVKPIALMAYLCRLVTPPHGTVLDLFMGSGSTGIAALREGFNFIGIEVNPEYVEIALRRIEGDAPLFNKQEKAG